MSTEDKSSRVPPFDPDTCKDFKSWLVAFFLVVKRSFRAPADAIGRNAFEGHLTRAITIFHRTLVENRDHTVAQVMALIAAGFRNDIPVAAQNTLRTPTA